MKDWFTEVKDVNVRPDEEPSITALGGQTIEEVKELIKQADEWEKEQACLKTKALKDALEGKEEGVEAKLLYENLPEECVPDLRVRNINFRRNVDEFALWRKLADVKLGADELSPDAYAPSNDLMDHILSKLKKDFPKLNMKWSEESWNPSLLINNCPTKISIEKALLSYQGLLHIIDELQAKYILSDIISKKLKELFI